MVEILQENLSYIIEKFGIKYMKFPRVLIISPEPYIESSTSRYLSSFFGQWDENAIAQFYTTRSLPTSGFCRYYYRITDEDMLNNLLGKVAPGQIFSIFEKSTVEKNHNLPNNKEGKLLIWVKRRLNTKTPLFQLIRLVLWREKYWNNKKFKKWIDDFSPELLFLDLGPDNRLAKIAISISQRKNIPIITFLPDDFYFKIKNYFSPFTVIYSYLFKRTTKYILSVSAYNIFSCNMMKEIYCKKFKCSGDVLYFISNIKRVPWEGRKNNTFSYLGSLEYGRWKSLVKVGNALQEISKDFYLDVFSNIENRKCKLAFERCRGIKFHGRIPYSKVIETMQTSQFVIHVEDFDSKNKKHTKYSLSTKIADCLTCGAITIAFGPKDIGSIDYLIDTGAALVCINENKINSDILNLINNNELRNKIICNSLRISKKNHSADINQENMREICESVIKNRYSGKNLT